MVIELPRALAQSIQHFTGRTWILPDLLRWLNESDDRIFILTGGPGAGKSAIIAWLAGEGPAPTDSIAIAQLEQVRAKVCATHFNIAASGNISPKAFAENIAQQLTRSIEGFGAALAASLSDRVQISGTVDVGQMHPGASATGVRIERLDLGDLGEELSFDRILREPLKKLYENGFDSPTLLLVDALDEAATYTGAVTIAQLLTKLTDLPPQVKVLATTRPNPRVLYLFPDVEPLDLIRDAPEGEDDISLYVYERLVDMADENERRTLAKRIADASEGVFLYAHLVIRDLFPDFTSRPDLMALPKGLSGLYLDSLNRQLGPDRSRWFDTFRPVLGLVAVAQGDGLNRTQLGRISKKAVDEPLEVIVQYLDGEWPDGPFRPFHQSLVEFLRDKSNAAYRIEPATMHRTIADYYWSFSNGAGPWHLWDYYGLRYTPTHLAEATLESDPPDRHDLADRLVSLVASPDFQSTHYSQINDLDALQGDLERALISAAADPAPSALPLVLQSAHTLVEFRRENLRPETVFELARQGNVDVAVRRLDLFDIDPEWKQASLLTIAWLAFDSDPEHARRLRDTVESSLNPADTPGTLLLLLQRLDNKMGGPPAAFEPLPAPLSADVSREIVHRMGGQGVNVELLASYGLELQQLETQGLGTQGYLAEQDGPALVAYAASPETQDEDGDRFLKEYIDLHSSYNYQVYRNNSLMQLLAAVLRHPEQAWVQSMLPRLAEAALAGSDEHFQGSLPIAILAWQARNNIAESIKSLEEQRDDEFEAISKLTTDRGQGDTWGRHSRQLGAMAEAFAHLLDRSAEANELLARALDLPYGFAGFRSPACLALAESIHVCQPHDSRIYDALHQAREAAHNIQDPTLCARTTARVNAFVNRWWPQGGYDMSTLSRLVEDPTVPEYSALYYVGEDFSLRSRPSAIPFDDLLQADTLEALALAFQRPLAEFRQLNPEYGPTEHLAPGTPINVPDPGMPPRLAAWFAAETLADSSLSAHERASQIRSLVPIAAVDITSLYTVMARYLMAAAQAYPPDSHIMNSDSLAYNSSDGVED